MPSLRDMKIAGLKKSLKLLMEQYTAVDKQLRLETNPATKPILQAQLADIEAQIETAETGLAGLENDAPKPSAPVDDDQIRRELYRVLTEYYNIAELHDLMFDNLGLDHEEDIGVYQNRKELVRELMEYCRRHGRFAELVTIVKAARPHAWNN